MSDLIKREDAIKALCDAVDNKGNYEGEWLYTDEFCKAIDSVPSADRPSAVDLSSVYSTAYKNGYEKGKADRLQGEWIDVNGDGSLWRCDQCKDTACCKGNYCPNCGCRMKGADDE